MLKKEEDIQEYTPASILHKAGEECELDVATMSADDTICGCNGVTKGTIVHAILEQELKTFEEVKACTKAAGSCGKCRPLVEQVLSHTLEMLLMLLHSLPVCADVHLYHVMKS